ncbi:MAG: orotidine-5'-phosphate decarboxylase [Trueperaceae bacterium]
MILLMTFSERLTAYIKKTNSRVCLGIDPRPKDHPSTHPDAHNNDPAQTAKAVVTYFRNIIEVTHDLVACYKLQSAFFEAMGIPGLIALAQLTADIKALEIPVILDAKRGDIGSTAQAYAEAYLGQGVFSSDALTVNPYLGMDSLEPFLEAATRNGRGIFVLVKTSNPGSADFQDLETKDGLYLFDEVAYRLQERSKQLLGKDGFSPLGVVVGATYPEQLEELREVLPNSLFLVPGYGSQGAAAGNVVRAFDENALGAVVNASRSLTYFAADTDYQTAARAAALEMQQTINDALGV